MLVVVMYDICTETSLGRKRLRTAAKFCHGYGRRVQASVYECLVNAAEFEELKHGLHKMIDQAEDSVRFYNLGNQYDRKVTVIGLDNGISSDSSLIF